MGAPERVIIGETELWRGRWEEVYHLFPREAAVVSDPPYGIAFDFTKERKRGASIVHGMRKRATASLSRWDHSIIGDTQPFDPSPWLSFPEVILWGGNHYASRLPDSGAWLIWDKRDGRTSDHMSDCEIAWSNLGKAARVHRQLWRGMVRVGEDNTSHGPKTHPAQKPIELLLWCVMMTRAKTVIDPYMGSGTTLVACVRLRRRGIGVECERVYFDTACRRVEEAYRQLTLFPPPAPTPPVLQLALLGGQAR